MRTIQNQRGSSLSRRDFIALSSLGVIRYFLPKNLVFASQNNVQINSLFDSKLGIKFVFGGMAHETAHEGPCRVGRLDDLTYQAEMKGLDRQFSQFVNELRGRDFPREAEILEPVDFRMLVKEKDTDFKFPEQYFAQVEKDISNTDLIVVVRGFASDIALKIAERFNRPVATIGNDWVVDVPATLRHRGFESYIALDWEDFNRLIHLLWVRKAFSLTKLLIVTDRLGEAPFGLASAIYDFDQLNKLYGMQYHQVSNQELTQEMDCVIARKSEQKKAEAIAKKLMANANAVHMSEKHVIHSVNFYLAAKGLMNRHGCNAFTIECREICPLEIAAKYQFTPCMTMSMLKDAGFPTVCQTDINALIPMMALSYLGKRSVYMGNPVFDAKNDILSIFHDVPGLKMKGFDSPSLPYELRNFTVAGWGVTFRYDFSRDKGQVVTIARANPGQTKILLTRGEIQEGFGFNKISCSLGVRIKVRDTLKLFRNAADYGGHLIMAFGDYIEQMEDLSEVMNFDLLVV